MEGECRNADQAITEEEDGEGLARLGEKEKDGVRDVLKMNGGIEKGGASGGGAR